MAPVVQNKEAEIRKLGSDLSNKADATLDPAKSTVDNIDVGFPNFSMLGFPLYLGHKVFQHQASESVFQARQTIRDWKSALDKVANTWHKANEASSPKTN